MRVAENAEVRLPTEWEWQWAAQNGSEARQYPWGNWQPGHANTNEAGLGRVIAVGMYPQGAAACGALDMAGNLFEWCLNDYDSSDATRISNHERKALRGGSFNSIRNLAACAYRGSLNPVNRYGDFGFRLVVAAPMRL